MLSPLQIIGFGAVSVDKLIYVDQPLGVGQGKVERYLTSHGGNVATALVAAVNLGVEAGFIGWLSNQPKYKFCLDELEAQGVNIHYAPRSEDAAPICSTITVGSDGDRFIAYDDNILHGTDPNLSDAVFSQAKILMIDAYATSSIEIIKRARTLGLQVVADIEWSVGDETRALMDVSDHLVVPWEFAEKFTLKHDVSSMLNALWSPERMSVVVTKGAEGAYVLAKNDEAIWHVPAYSVEPADTTGAGDCFHGAFAAALVNGKSAVECTSYASAAAAISTTGLGGRGALPTHKACIHLMTTQQQKPISLS